MSYDFNGYLNYLLVFYSLNHLMCKYSHYWDFICGGFYH
jgi:hypothetical protein